MRFFMSRTKIETVLNWGQNDNLSFGC
jgi:hypothetical protein